MYKRTKALHVAILYHGAISDASGTDERVVQIAKELANQGLEITLVGHKTTRLNAQVAANLHLIDSRIALKWLSRFAASSLISKYDIVQVESFPFIESLALFILLRPLNKKFVIVFHDKWFQKDPRRNIVRGKPSLFLQKVLLNIYDASITPGISVKKWFEELHGKLVTRKMVVIPNGAPNLAKGNFDNSQYLREKNGLSPNAFVVLFFGSMSFKPNHDAALYLYRISDYVSYEFEKQTEKQLIFVIAGSGTETLPRTRFYIPLGFVDDINELLSLPNLIILPHLESYSGPHVKTIYAFLSGKPVVATDDAVKDMPGVLPRKHFLKFVIDEPNTLVLRLIELYRDKGLSEYLARNAHTYAEIFSWKSIACIHRRFYESLIAG